MKKIGILAFQGGVIEHRKKLESLGAEVVDVRYPKDLENLSAIIMPGGESTCIKRLLKRFDLLDPLALKLQNGLPVWGTCAGAILLAKKVDNENNDSPLALFDIHVHRNAYGSQLDSFTHLVQVPFISKEIKLIFIRAPKIIAVNNDVSPLITIMKGEQQQIVAASYKNFLATTFHPELDSDTSFHDYFLREFVGHGHTN